MKPIATLTLNPTIDAAYSVAKVAPQHKMRAASERYDPGGGGINVARVLVRLGANARCYYLSGGATGHALDGLLDLHQLVRTRIPVAGQTRMACAIFEESTRQEYRIVPPGPTVSPQEWQQCLDVLDEADCDWLVASGSLPPGVPPDFYARLADRLKRRGIRLVLDSSGEGLTQGLAGGGVHMVKPSLGELRQVTGRPLETEAEVAEAAMAIVRAGKAELVAVTLAAEGALLAHCEGTMRLPAIPVEAKSATGAGDSFLAAMVFALAGGQGLEDAFRLGMAGGAAAVLTPGTELALPADIARLRAIVNPEAG